jgi:hypothetical protein
MTALARALRCLDILLGTVALVIALDMARHWPLA